MIINRNSLDGKFLSNIKFLEEKFHLIIQLEYVKDVVRAHCFSTDFQLLEIATIDIGIREDSKERLYVRLSKELKRIMA